MEHNLSEHKLFSLTIDVNRTFKKKNGPRASKSGLLLCPNAKFFATKLVVASVAGKSPIFEQFYRLGEVIHE